MALARAALGLAFVESEAYASLKSAAPAGKRNAPTPDVRAGRFCFYAND
jgi:hypothetical protein